jgi:hypothetical protein
MGLESCGYKNPYFRPYFETPPKGLDKIPRRVYTGYTVAEILTTKGIGDGRKLVFTLFVG